MTLLQFWRIMVAWRLTILGMMATCVIVALVSANKLPERYTARARVLLDLFNADPNQFISVNNNTVGPYIGTQIRLISEYDVTGQVVDKLGWLNDPSVTTAWETETGGTGDLRRWAAARIADNTFAETVGGSGILEIGYSATDPQYAARIAGLLREAYISQSLANRAAMADRSAKWSEGREVKATEALRAAETVRTDFARANGIVLDQRGESLELVELQQIQALLTSRHGAAGNKMAEGVRAAAGAPGVVRLKSQLADMEQGLGVASDRLGEKNPEFKAMQQQRDRLQANVGRESAMARAGGSQFVQLSAAEVAALEAKYRDKQKYILDHKAAFDQFQTLQRQVDLRRRLQRAAAESTLALKQMASVSESGLVVFGDVLIDTKPSFPDIPRIGALAAAFGLILGVTCALFGEMTERRVRGPEDLEFSSQVPLIGSVGGSVPMPRRRRRWWPQWRAAPGLQPAE